ncbi:hypothetical protein [Mammaliicoccus sp. Dog046]|uniref:hypothetical protein n=1 Tax=Mammaliicoccus sp. Dog046 TaxID=3034233 RepID=UPI002B25A052|nr:hypothetical protein [Mammaliicoccus sp. Dog046]WQK85649.1 hypothetical protein P3U32_01055 [Mammaliicoccus sp. Dog046]
MSQDHQDKVNQEIEEELLAYLENKDQIEAEKPVKKGYRSWMFICMLIILCILVTRIVMQIF